MTLLLTDTTCMYNFSLWRYIEKNPETSHITKPGAYILSLCCCCIGYTLSLCCCIGYKGAWLETNIGLYIQNNDTLVYS